MSRLDLTSFLPTDEADIATFSEHDLRIIRWWANFWMQADRPTDPNACWEWMGQRDKRGGYGIYGRSEKAHRVAFELVFGSPEELLVMHRCDNPPCVRPSHLMLGTSRDNSRDMAAKGRARHSKLTPDQVREIRTTPMMYGDGRRLAASLGIHPTTLSRIRTGQTWKEVMPK